jgi:Flp pilus assembly protein TadD
MDEARQAFTTALELDPENLIALRSMGEIAYANGEFGDARRWYERLLESDPRNSEVAQLIGPR